MQSHLSEVLDLIEARGLEGSLKTFVNRDGTADAEVRIGGLPDEWKIEEGVPALMEFLSDILRDVGVLVPENEGGGYWVSIGVRFGPSNESDLGELAELYKRHRGLFQVATYALSASMMGGMMNAVVGVGHLLKTMESRRGLPPAVVFIRFTWVPDGKTRPGRYKGERGGGG